MNLLLIKCKEFKLIIMKEIIIKIMIINEKLKFQI